MRRILVASLAAIFILPSAQAAASLSLPILKLPAQETTQERERKEAEKREAEKREAEKREAEKLEAEKREAEKREAEKREAEAKEAAGRAKYRLDAASYFDKFGTEQYAPWVRAHVSLIKGYPPYSDKYVSMFGLPVIGYHDPATEGQAPLEQSGIEAYVAQVRRDIEHGYGGVFVDDANWSSGYSPSSGPPANLARLLDTLRSDFPGITIEMNSQYHDIWPLMKAGNPYVARALKDVNIVTKEFGVGPNAGISTAQDYREYVEYVDQLHAKGIHVVACGDGSEVSTMEYNLATLFLGTDGSDYVNGNEQTPENWWVGYEAEPGSPTGARERLSSGLWRRAFSGGVVYVVEPGAARQTIRLPKPMHSAEWGTVESVTLSAGQGAVLTG
jgi:hypothetical protein